MARSTQADKARQLNAAHHLLQRGISLPEAVRRLSREFDLSGRQAYRYLEQATHLDRPVEVSEATVPMTLKLPARTARLLRAYARSSGLTIGAIVTRALAVFLILREGMAEPRPTRGALQVHVDYLFDRLHDSKLVQAYVFLCPFGSVPSAAV